MEVKRIWTEVYSEYLGRLQPDVAAKIGSTNSDLSLIGGVDRLCKRYKERRTVHNLRRLEPFLCSIRSFTQVISTFTQHDAQISVLVWGSISFVLEVSIGSLGPTRYLDSVLILRQVGATACQKPRRYRFSV